MRWVIVRLIWQRELRDLARDRRWLFMLLGLPVLLYPAFGLVGLVFAQTIVDPPSRVGFCGFDHFPRLAGPASELTWAAVLPVPGGTGLATLAGAAVAVTAGRPFTADLPLVAVSDGAVHFL